MSTPVEVRGLRVTFGSVIAVDDVDLTVASRSSLALVGRNGAGKSTTMRVVAGVVPPTAGEVIVGGVDVRADPVAARARVGYCPDTGGLIPRATPWEHLQLSARLRGLAVGSWESRADELLDRFDLRAAADRITAGFSHGMGRRLSVVLAAFCDPEVLLLDEPFDGVDPLGVDATLEVIAEARVRGGAIVVSTHLLAVAAMACDEIMVLRRGSVAGAAPAADMAGDAGAERYRALLT